MINERGGLSVTAYHKKIPLKFVAYDDASKQENAVKFYERLVTVDQVHLLRGPYSSPLTFAASTVAEKHGIPMVADVCLSASSSNPCWRSRIMSS